MFNVKWDLSSISLSSVPSFADPYFSFILSSIGPEDCSHTASTPAKDAGLTVRVVVVEKGDDAIAVLEDIIIPKALLAMHTLKEIWASIVTAVVANRLKFT